MENEVLEAMEIEELEVMVDEIKAIIKEKKEYAKIAENEAKIERANKFKGLLKEGDTVVFMYGRDNEEVEGVIVRTSEKTVTVESDVFNKGKGYVRYDRFVEVLESAQAEEDTYDNDVVAESEELAEAIGE